MSRRNFGRLGDSKGAELLAQLKSVLTPSRSPATPAPCADASRKDLPRGRAARPHLTSDAQRATRDLKSKKAKKDRKNGITVIKTRNAAERAIYREALSSNGGKQEQRQRRTTAAKAHDFGEAAFKKLAPLRESLEGFEADHGGPSDIPPEDAALTRRRIALAAEKIDQILDPADGYFLGYDFGTSTTKVVARWPYGAVDEAFAIEVPSSLASGGQAHLFPTAVYWNRELDHFSLVPAEGYVRLHSFKSALIHGRGHRLCHSTVMMAHAAVAFVALHLAYCIGAAIDARSKFRLASVNAGIPVAALDGHARVDLFDQVLRAATRLIAKAPSLSCADVKAAFESNEESPVPFTSHAELSGAIAGYCAATRHYLGGHMIIDCGSATLDVVTFDLSQQTHRPIGIYAACVENLGADACALYVKLGEAIETCRDAVRFEEHLVYRQTIKARPSLFCYENGHYPYQIILVGAGIHSEVHAPLLAKLADAFEKPFELPTVAPTLRYDRSCEAGRLILADGLARDPIELKDVVLPTPPPPPKWRDPDAPGKEQV